MKDPRNESSPETTRQLLERFNEATRHVSDLASPERKHSFYDLQPPRPLTCRITKSTFGRQMLSQKPTEPTVIFGNSDRVKMDKIYYSPELAKCQIGRYGPGPVYELKSSLGKQSTSNNESAPQISFGVADRFSRRRYSNGTPGPGTYNAHSGFGHQILSYQKSPWFADFGRSSRDQQTKMYMSSEFDKSRFGTGSPGPTICDGRSSLGTQVEAHNKSAPKVSFGSERRFKYNLKNPTSLSPGVGQYNSVASVGKQPESRKNSFPSYSFTLSDRDRRAKLFISVEHDKCHYGEESPGPGSIPKSFTSLGPQVDSRKLSSNVLRFGTAARFKEYYSDNPGPGEYDC